MRGSRGGCGGKVEDAEKDIIRVLFLFLHVLRVIIVVILSAGYYSVWMASLGWLICSMDPRPDGRCIRPVTRIHLP
jgi:hypothetical protein